MTRTWRGKAVPRAAAWLRPAAKKLESNFLSILACQHEFIKKSAKKPITDQTLKNTYEKNGE